MRRGTIARIAIDRLLWVWGHWPSHSRSDRDDVDL
jgi:hypothetical protein